MNDQSKTPGAMVLVPRLRLEAWHLHAKALELPLMSEEMSDALSKQTPAVGELDWSKSVYEHCRSCSGWLPLLDGSCRPCIELRAALARIEELEAQQGEPLAIGTLHRDCDERIVFESSGEIHIKDGMDVYAQPATAKVVLPERMSITAEASGFKNGELKGWNACLDEIAKMNGIKP